MIPGGESKRKLGDVWPQLVLALAFFWYHRS
jgi:hypothetical protein